jgi:hypothetical protein
MKQTCLTNANENENHHISTSPHHHINLQMKAKIILTSCLVLLCMFSMAQTKAFEHFSIGVGGGYTNYQTFSPEIAIHTNFTAFQRPFELKAGVDYRSFDASFQTLNDLETKSVGFFVDASLFPFHKYFYAGVRWNLIDFNWLTDSALKKLESNLSSNAFSGTSFYGIAGIDIPVTQNISFRLQGMPGVQQYKISDGNFSSGSYVLDGTIQEDQVKFVWQVNAGIVIRLK